MAGATDANAAQTIAVTLVAADRLIWEGPAVQVSVPASEGSMGILVNHEPLMAATKHGVVAIKTTDGQRLEYDVEDGFIAFDSNRLTIAVERASLHR